MNRKVKKGAGWFAFYAFVILYVLLLLLPFIWQFLTSVKPLNEIAEMPAKWIPSYFNIQFYINVFTKHPFARYMLNSLIVALSSTLLSIAIGATAAYALSRLHFKGRKVLLMTILGVSMFPTIATLSPLYLILKNLKLLNSYRGLILTYISFSLPMAIWLMGLLVFINCWNEYLYALTFMSQESMRTVPVGIALFPSNYQLPWGDMAAASIVCTVPLILLVLIGLVVIFKDQLTSLVGTLLSKVTQQSNSI